MLSSLCSPTNQDYVLKEKSLTFSLTCKHPLWQVCSSGVSGFKHQTRQMQIRWIRLIETFTNFVSRASEIKGFCCVTAAIS